MYGHEYDFGSGMPLPPSAFKHDWPSGSFSFSQPYRNFTKDADRELIEYMRSRNVSPHFLSEIDKFLDAHPEIARFQPDFAYHVNHPRPLHGYRFFVQGYTKPARYIDGALPDPRAIPPFSNPMPLALKYDEELNEFFNGSDYRVDILRKIDEEVRTIAYALCYGQRVSHSQRKLVVFAVWGNLVDAFKFYEYNYQTEWLPHRYLAEHTNIPKPADYRLPVPRQIAYEDEDCRENKRSYPGTRARMARACDVGVDVIEVLLDDYTASLCREGFRRNDIERMRREAMRSITHERDVGSGRDIVDLVMDGAAATTARPPPRISELPRRANKRMKLITSMKNTLHRLLIQEASLYKHGSKASFVRADIRSMRQRVERELVTEATEIASQRGIMRPDVVQQWRALYTSKAQKHRELYGPHIDLVLEMTQYLGN
ncbi:hypothetical protein LTR37_009689 [Vermiconidia calcicola]|uniref:Uncharacterized protein n=1 Tax=Vermiconidia calcicola TaxID=1690605 RepID=A0ACC3N878_9PEZI|nr:hypothetical protein LTR37_009689 [Vermiconidia calcicola]